MSPSLLTARIEELDAALPSDLFEREPIPYEAAFLAGKGHLAHRRRGGTRRSPLPDFLSGPMQRFLATGCSPATRPATALTSRNCR